MKLQALKTLRKAGHVQRWHTEFMIQQNNAAHSWNTVTLLLLLEPNASRDAIVYMHMHDVAEVVTGDFPAPVKWKYPELKSLLARIEHDTEQEIGYDPPELSEYEKRLCKYCDMAELVLTCWEQRCIGNHYALVPGFKVLRRMRAALFEDDVLLVHNERCLALLKYLETRYALYSESDANWR